MTFPEFIAERARLDAAVEAASAALQPFPRNALGLTPDDVKAAPEWKAAYAAYWRAHGQLRAFNSRYAPMFKADLRAARRAKATQVAAAVLCVGMLAGMVEAPPARAADVVTLPYAAPAYDLLLLVNRMDGTQSEHVLARDLPAADCVPMMQAIWRANGDAPAVGLDELGPIPAFDAVCMPVRG